MGRTWKPVLVLAAFGLTLALGSILSPALAGEGNEEKIEALKAKKHALQEKALAVRREGKIDEYRKLRRKIREIDQKIRELSRGREAHDREGLLKKLKMLYALQARARQQKNHEAVRRLQAEIDRLRAEIHGNERGGPPAEEQAEMQRKLDAVHKRINALKKERDKSLEEFDLDRVDALSREIAKLSEEGARIKKAMERGGKERPGPRDPAAERARLFEELREASERGDEKAVQAIREEIARLGRGEAGHKPFAPEAVEGIERIVHKMEQWARDAEKHGNQNKAKALAGVARGFRELAQKTRACRGPEDAKQIARYLEEVLGRAYADLKRAQKEGDEERVELLEWASKQIKGVLGHMHKRLRAPREHGGNELRMKIDWLMKKAEQLQKEGRHEEAEKHRRLAEQYERRLHAQEKKGEERERHFREAEERIEHLMRESREAQKEGDKERAKELRRKAMDLRRELAQARRHDEGNRRRGKAGRGRGDRERQLDRDRHLANLRRELDRAEREGDEERMEDLRREIDRHRRAMDRRERPDRERPDRESDERRRMEEERRSREARELKKEIDRLRRELHDLKKLLKRLLKEKEKD